MSDADLRALERRWRETGSVEDEVAWLRGRVQASQLSQERLRFCAFLGHEAAGSALGRERLDPHYGKLASLVYATPDRELLVRLSHAALRVAAGEPCSRPDLLPELRGSLIESERAILAGEAGGHLGTAQFALGSLQAAHDLVVNDEVYQSLREDLVPWALGYGDPVRERVEARSA